MSKGNTPILPLTREDIVGTFVENSTRSDRLSVNESQTSLPTYSTYLQKQKQRERMSSIKGSFDGRLKIPKYFKRMLNFKSLDFETAFWEIMNLIIHPKRVYKSLYYQKHTKNKWARDDPSFVIILCLFLTISAILWGLMYSHGIIGIFKLVLYMVIVDFIAFGLAIATIGWLLANNVMFIPGTQTMQSSNKSIWAKILKNDSILEWTYCFDVHCNAYLIIWVLLYLVQFIFLPILRMNNIISTLIGNTLYLVALSYYFLVTFYGYNSLPFLHKTEYILVPIIIFGILWIVLTISGFNIANYMCTAYFN
ncbi:Gmh1 protein [Martiniozyma asiatica (nom. inval.)]|nr:Gmh1 protein [Martiniozyma asiatica]